MKARNRIALYVAAAGIAATLAAGTAPAQEVVGHSIAQTGNNLTMTLDLSDGRQIAIRLANGTVFVNDSAIGAYQMDPQTAAAGAALATEAASQTTAQLLAALRALDSGRASGTDSEPLDAAFARATRLALTRALGSSGLRDRERAVVAPEPVVPVPAQVADARPVRVRVETVSPSLVGGIATGLANLGAAFAALGLMGLGLVFFAPRELETVADTVWHSFGRSFLAGLFAQPLVLPAFGMLIVGLALTVVGILVIPFAVLAFALALGLAAVGGFVGVARAVGEVYLRRRMARGEAVATWGSYRYIVYGLVGLLAIWLPAIVLGWIPVAGHALLIVAAVSTWVFATAGFGAAILSRGGVRGTFVRKLDLALTDEHYWTAEGMPTSVRRRSRRDA